jgi:hypothetical protein
LDETNACTETNKVNWKIFRNWILHSVLELKIFCFARIYYDLKFNETGEPDEFLKSVNHVDETKFGIAVCTVDGQRFSIGDAKTQFSLQALARPITYGCLLSTHFGLQFHFQVSF